MSAALPSNEREKIQKLVNELDPSDTSSDAMNLRGVVISHADWISSNFQREKQKIAWKEFFKEWDILICPQMATPAFEHDHRPFGERTIMVNNQEQPYFQQVFWAGMIVNAYLPSTVFPTGPSSDGLPIGLQAVGDAYQDYKTIEFSKLIADEIGGFVAPPNYA